MTTTWKRLTRRDLTTFDTFATDAVLTAMELGGVGAIASNGHAKIRGKNGATMLVSRDTSAPHCQGNVMKALKRTFPELKTGAPQKDSTMTSNGSTPPLECPAKGCDQTFSDASTRQAHIDRDHYVCDWEGCDYGPGGTVFVAKSKQSKAGHINTRHRGYQPWLVNPEKAAINRAASFAAKKKARVDAAANAAANAETLKTAASDAAKAATSSSTMTAHPTLTGGANYLSVDEAKAAAKAESNGHAPTVDVPAQDGDAEAKLALIREILGDDLEVAALKKELADLKAHLALVREAVGLDFGTEDATN